MQFSNSLRFAVWGAVWCAMFSVVLYMCWDMSQENPALFAILIIAMIVGSIGPAYASQAWRNGAVIASASAAIVAALAIGVTLVLETSYWTSTAEKMSMATASEKSVAEARDLVSAKRRERYAQMSGAQTPEQVSAQISIAQQNDRWRLSKGCTAATTRPSQDFCADYFRLQGLLSAATEAKNIEGVVWAAATNVEGYGKRDLTAAAMLGAKVFGGDAQTWIAVFIGMFVMLSQTVLAFAIYIGTVPYHAKAAIAQPAIVAKHNDISMASPTIPPAMPDDNGPKGGFSKPVEKPIENARVENVTQLTRAKPVITKGDVKAWLQDCTSQTADTNASISAKDAYVSYKAWCNSIGVKAANQKQFSRNVNRALALPTTGKRHRDDKGARFPGLAVYSPAPRLRVA